MMVELTLEEELQELSTAEDFLDFFDIEYDASTVQVNRLHILQRFHNYLNNTTMPEDEAAQRAIYTELLTRAYQDFVTSDALTEKVFKVFHMHEPQKTFVPLDQVFK